ncbi:MAG: Rrf2 family transcriptional regulator [Gemmatimonadetes bacterium]|nr:Rrf2 family transcriptional regulator [Gemmatimonadota bacterium]MBT6149194.1 Rrf2 family transcriptional regulator [Gemmatimonadota bacterium]MBT7860483.1 Rrf2 family transcriptional regulator [Gemmatimonadota bacterium]
MKLTAQEEYGLRCLVRLARRARGQTPGNQSTTIPEIAEAEGVSPHNVAKYLSVLRKAGFIDSERGQHGGYTLARPATEISVADVVATLGGPLFDTSFCDHYSGTDDACQHTAIDCSIRGVWMRVQGAVDTVLRQTTLQDLLQTAEQHERAHGDSPVGLVSSELLQVEGS